MQRRRWISWLALGVLASAAILVGLFAWYAAQEESVPPNTLTTEEATEGWVLLFDGATTSGWTTEGASAVRNGCLLLGGDRPALATSADAFNEFELRFDYRLTAGQEALLEMNWAGSGSSFGLG